MGEPSKKTVEWGRAKILVVDDEASVLESLKMILGIKDYDVITAASGFEAIEALQKEEIDLVLTDIRMPGMDGLEVLKKAKELKPDVEVLMVTAYASMESSVQAMRLGAMDYLQKPFLMEQVYQMVDRAMRKRQTNLANRALLETVKPEVQLEKFDELAVVRKIDEMMGKVKTVDEAVQSLIGLVKRTIDYQVCGLYVVDKKKTFIDLNRPTGYDFTQKFKAKMVEHAAEYGAPSPGESTEVILDEKKMLLPESKDEELNSLIADPLKIRGRLIGILALGSSERDTYTKQTQAAFTTIANRAALALDDILLYEQLKA